MTATVFLEATHPFAFVVSESPSYQSRDNVLLANGVSIVVGQLLGTTGVVANETATVAPVVNNTGNGTLTVASIGGAAIDGVYAVVMQSAGATANFEVQDPNGVVVGEGKVGTAFAGPLNFNIASGGTPYAIGDQINIAVARSVANSLYEAWNPAATDGSQTAVAIAATLPNGENRITAITRRAEVRMSDLTFAAGATTAQINEAVVQLMKQGIICR